MRDLGPTGGAATQIGTLNLTTNGQLAVGMTREVYIPEGYKCLLSWSGRGVPSANTVTIGPYVDQFGPSPSSAQTVDMTFSGTLEIIKPGLHLVSFGGFASSAAGTLINSSIGWIIVRR